MVEVRNQLQEKKKNKLQKTQAHGGCNMPVIQWTTEQIKEEIKKYLETNENKNMMTQNLWDAAKEVLREKFIVIQAYFRKQERSQINKPTLHVKKLKKEKQNPKLV